MTAPKQAIYGVIVPPPDDRDGHDDQDLARLVQVINDTVLTYVYAEEVPPVRSVRLALNGACVVRLGISGEGVDLATDLTQMLAISYGP